MAERPAAERTEQPTARRLQKARGKGQVPQSQEMTSFVSIVVLITSVAFFAPGLMQSFAALVREGLSCKLSVLADNAAFIKFMNAKIIDCTVIACPVFAALCAGSVFAGIAVGGLNFAPEAIRLNLSVINPAGGLSKLLNVRSMVHLIVSIFKLLVVSAVVWLYLNNKVDTMAALRWAWSWQILTVTAKLILGMMIRICIALLVIAAADTIFQKWKYTSDLKMTKQEVKQERKDTEGLPEVKGRIRRIQLQTAMKRMLQEVPKATVILVNPTHVAVALRYEPAKMEAPFVVAKGADHLAEKIREIARAYGVPIVRRPELARIIYSTVEPGNPIPDTLYVAVAEVLAMIYRLRHRKS